MKNFTPIKNGLFTRYHAEKLGQAWFLFCKYCSFMHASSSKIDDTNNELCVVIYPKSIQKQLDIDAETWRDYHENLIREGYISAFLLDENDKIVVCIKKPIM